MMTTWCSFFKPEIAKDEESTDWDTALDFQEKLLTTAIYGRVVVMH